MTTQTVRAGLRDGISVASPINPTGSLVQLYVPRAHIVIPYGSTIVTSYYLNENGLDRFLTEDNANLLILES